jgi:hypothetical protein
MHRRRHIATSGRAVAGHDCSRTANHHASVASRPNDRTRRNRASIVNAAWIVLGIGVAVAMLILTTSWRRRDHERDLGSVSHQWMAEQRMGQRHDSQR